MQCKEREENKMKNYNGIFKADKFETMEKPWGNWRTLIGKQKIFRTDAWIGLFKENEDNRMFVAVHHGEEGTLVSALGIHWVTHEKASIQKALDEIANTLMNYEA